MANYLYGGIEAPALPESSLPVALMLASSATQTLTLCAAAPTISGESIVWADGARQHYQLIDGAWVLQLEDTGDGIVGTLGDGIAWCNVDILYEDGTVYLAGSEPVPVKWAGLKSWLMGFALGLAGKPLPLSVKTPVAYLYNGVQLPDIYKVYTPEVQETHPYAGIWYMSANKAYIFRCLSADAYYKLSNTRLTLNASSGLGCGTSGEYTEWGKFSELSGENYAYIPIAGYETTFPLVWTNFDAEHDGTSYMSASDPVPVYE